MTTEPTDPIFIIGTERSGSNLVRLILNSHSAVAVPHPPHLVRFLTPILASYGDLSDDRRFRRLVRDAHRLLRLHICPWDITVDPERVVRAARPRSPLGIHAAFYDQYREAKGKRRWGSKSTFLIDHVEEVLDRFPGARLLYLVRDPRDVAASSKQSVFNPYHPRRTARLWRKQQRRGLEILDGSRRGSVLLLRYEDLLREPEARVREICGFIGEPFEPGMLRYFETAEARRLSELSRCWANASRPILEDNAGKYRRDLRPREIIAVERIAADVMERFGYFPGEGGDRPGTEVRRAGAPDAQRDPALEEDRPGERLVDFLLGLRVEMGSLFRDRNHWRRWARALYLAHLRLRARLHSRK